MEAGSVPRSLPGSQFRLKIQEANLQPPELSQTPRQHEVPAAWSRVGDEGGPLDFSSLLLSKQCLLSWAREFSQQPKRPSVLGSEVAGTLEGVVGEGFLVLGELGRE